MKDIVMVSYRINDETDTEADLIVAGEACSFVELLSIGDGVQAINEGMDQLMKTLKLKMYWFFMPVAYNVFVTRL